ncbi:MAG TPA: helix-turn-helix domain-containing protein [Kribbella sp.]|uniref:IclR family transcriptional regulator n=1 Tax=Kribbella sp. TaxID=1871183 RepID=UPI002D79F3BC|nr:helix-turn-helix domain-containing protein [Kribbella sp.]HET6298884.1 helix-turn-helix domain-containing protein [Kribbella sp.]
MIENALVLYDSLRAAGPAMRLSDLSRSTGLPKSTTHRLLHALIASGLVVRFGVGYAAAERSGDSVSPADGRRDLLRGLAPFLGDLMVRTRLTASLAVLDGAEVVFVHRVYCHDNAPTPSDDSGRASAHRTASGRMLLAQHPRIACELAETWKLAPAEAAAVHCDLARIRRNQLAVVDAGGISCLALPVPVGPGCLPIVLAVKGKTGTFDHQRAQYWLRHIAQLAARSSRDPALASTG